MSKKYKKLNNVKMNHINELIKPFTCEPNSIVQNQYDQACTLNNVAQPLCALIDGGAPVDQIGMFLYNETLYYQIDRSSAMAIEPLITYFTNYIMSIFFNKLNEKLFEYTTGDQRYQIVKTMHDISIEYSINRGIYHLYTSTVTSNLDHICELCYNGEIERKNLDNYIYPFVSLFASNVVSDVANRLFNGIYICTLEYPETTSLFEDLNTNLVDLFKDLSFNLQDVFMNLTLRLANRIINRLHIYHKTKEALDDIKG